MNIDPLLISQHAFDHTGLSFSCTQGIDREGFSWLELLPSGYPASQTFILRVEVGWRRLDIFFIPGSFSSPLLELMGNADENGRKIFQSMLKKLRDDGADVLLSVNSINFDPENVQFWGLVWKNMHLEVHKGMFAINNGDDVNDAKKIEKWLLDVLATIFSLLPIETEYDSIEHVGFCEGNKNQVLVNTYERDRRNRAAAVSIHGYRCKACGRTMSEIYGEVANNMIDIHHVIPLSIASENYIPNIITDLLPLCPNCHAIAHRRNPPYMIEEIKSMININFKE